VAAVAPVERRAFLPYVAFSPAQQRSQLQNPSPPNVATGVVAQGLAQGLPQKLLITALKKMTALGAGDSAPLKPGLEARTV
jgi:hypothetical protein